MFKEEMQKSLSFSLRDVSDGSEAISQIARTRRMHECTLQNDAPVSQAGFKARPHRGDAAARDEIDRHVPERRHGGGKGDAVFVSLLVFVP